MAYIYNVCECDLKHTLFLTMAHMNFRAMDFKNFFPSALKSQQRLRKFVEHPRCLASNQLGTVVTGNR